MLTAIDWSESMQVRGNAHDFTVLINLPTFAALTAALNDSDGLAVVKTLRKINYDRAQDELFTADKIATQAKPFACRLHAYEEGETRPRHVRSGSSRPRQYAISEKKQHKQDHQQHRREYACLSTALWICHTDLAAVGGYLALMQSIK